MLALSFLLSLAAGKGKAQTKPGANVAKPNFDVSALGVGRHAILFTQKAKTDTDLYWSKKFREMSGTKSDVKFWTANESNQNLRFQLGGKKSNYGVTQYPRLAVVNVDKKSKKSLFGSVKLDAKKPFTVSDLKTSKLSSAISKIPAGGKDNTVIFGVVGAVLGLGLGFLVGSRGAGKGGKTTPGKTTGAGNKPPKGKKGAWQQKVKKAWVTKDKKNGSDKPPTGAVKKGKIVKGWQFVEAAKPKGGQPSKPRSKPGKNSKDKKKASKKKASKGKGKKNSKKKSSKKKKGKK